ncbi:chitinase [Microbacterium sp. Au-Mic1]|uniref:chitinase n=1 Tax=Microbacterium sp. Au-Mic1 TaxID=2906457 RepID=UPI001E641223|nr:chitinase [Microbacterium sp. Au-Mic1]MCE4027801.1 chitinase [Microbacterium sp. Au-Mic1]
MTGPSAPPSGGRLSAWRVLVGVLVALTVVAGIVVVPWFLLRDEAAPGAAPGPRWFGGYYDITATDPPKDVLSGSGSDAVVLAFVTAGPGDTCRPTWGGVYSLAEAGDALDLDRRIAQKRQDGAPVTVSFGGTRGAELATACASIGDLMNAYAAVLERYTVTAIDLDLEHPALSDVVAGDRRAEAVARLQERQRAKGSELSVWLTLPAGQDGLGTDGLRSIRQLLQAGVQLSGVNAMTMDDSAPLAGRSMAAATITALTAVHDQLGRLYDDLHLALPAGGAWAVMGATPMIGRNDVHDEVFALDDAATLNAFAQKQRLARLSMWSLNRDRACDADQQDPASASCSGVAQGDSAFAAVLGRGFAVAPTTAAEPGPTASTSGSAAAPYTGSPAPPPASTPTPTRDP